LSILPINTMEELINKLQGLSNKYPEIQAVYTKYAAPYYEKKTQDLLSSMRNLIKKNNIDKAISIAQMK
ncbi:MAG: hypothetical protein ABIO02_04715, partial [Patescibacteria group bacterium]